jgi:GDPmannose 4,6-dehydratase
LRDWGHARDYVRVQWLMLQQERPQDFVIATGIQISVRDFVRMAASHLGLELRFEGEGLDEKAVVAGIRGNDAPALKVGDTIVAVDPRYFRPSEVETLLGDSSKARNELGWVPEITVQDMCAEMVMADLSQAKRHSLLLSHGFPVLMPVENGT